MGINNVAMIAGSFIGLILGGLLAPLEWRLVFLVSVPFGLFGTRVGLHEAEGHRHPQARPHRLVGQPHLRRRVGGHLDRHHLRHPALRRPHHGLDQPVRARHDRRRARRARRLRGHRDQGGRADVPTRALSHPGLRRRQLRQPAGRPGSGRADVHPHHLAAGHLAAPARLHLQPDAAVGRHLHAPADGRPPGRRTGVGDACRPLRRPALRHRRAPHRRVDLRHVGGAARRLPLSGASPRSWS